MAIKNKKILSKLSFLKKKFFIIFIILSLLLISIDFIIKIKRNNYFLDQIYIYSNISLDKFYNSYETNNSTNKVLSYQKAEFGNWLLSKNEKVNIFFLAQVNTSSEVFKEPIKIIEIDYNISQYKLYISNQILKKKNISDNKLIERINSNYYSSKKIILVISNSKNDTNDEVRNIIAAHDILYRNSYLDKCLENKKIFEKQIKIEEDYCNPIIYHESHSGDSLKRFNIYNLIFFYLLLFSGLCISFFYKKIK